MTTACEQMNRNRDSQPNQVGPDRPLLQWSKAAVGAATADIPSAVGSFFVGPASPPFLERAAAGAGGGGGGGY